MLLLFDVSKWNVKFNPWVFVLSAGRRLAGESLPFLFFFVERSSASNRGSLHMARTSGSIHMDRSNVEHAHGECTAGIGLPTWGCSRTKFQRGTRSSRQLDSSMSPYVRTASSTVQTRCLSHTDHTRTHLTTATLLCQQMIRPLTGSNYFWSNFITIILFYKLLLSSLIT